MYDIKDIIGARITVLHSTEIPAVQRLLADQFEVLRSVDKIIVVACGTAAYAGMVAKYWFEQFARVPVDLDVASEFRYRAPVMEEGGLALFISQSGETADTLASLTWCKAQGLKTAAEAG